MTNPASHDALTYTVPSHLDKDVAMLLARIGAANLIGSIVRLDAPGRMHIQSEGLMLYQGSLYLNRDLRLG
jgi:hypothetical protein